MNLQALKLELIEWISRIQDQSTLENLLNIKDSSNDKDWWDELTESQRKEIEKGIADHENGRILTNQEFWSKHGKEI